MDNNNNNNRKTWRMLKRAIPPIVPTIPPDGTDIDVRYTKVYDAQWNTNTGHDKNTTLWVPHRGTGYSSAADVSLNIQNGTWMDKNYLQFNGNGKAVPVTQRERVPNSFNEIYIVEGLGRLTYRVTDGTTKFIDILENSVIAKRGSKSMSISIPGKDVRMVWAYTSSASNTSYLIVYDKDGKRYVKQGSLGDSSRVHCDSSVFFEGFTGKVYSMKWDVSYSSGTPVIGWGSSINYTRLDKEFAAAKERFRL